MAAGSGAVDAVPSAEAIPRTVVGPTFNIQHQNNPLCIFSASRSARHNATSCVTGHAVFTLCFGCACYYPEEGDTTTKGESYTTTLFNLNFTLVFALNNL